MKVNKNIKQTLISGGRSLAQSQVPYAPIVTTLPLANDPQSQDGSLVVLTGTASDGLYSFNGTTRQWTLIANIASAPTNPYTLLNSDTTVITANANTTADQNLMAYNVGANVLNTVGKTLRLTCKGVYTTAAGGTIVSIKAKLGGVLVVNLTIATPAAAVTTFGWRMCAEFVTRTTGAGGGLELGFWSIAADTTAGGNCQTRIDAQDAASGAINLTIANTLQIIGAFSAASASNILKQRLFMVELLN
jgi:hypothetical protein